MPDPTPNPTVPAHPAPPRHRPIRWPELRPGAAAEIYDGDTVSAERFEGSDFSGRDLSHTGFVDCELRRCSFTDTDLSRLHLATSVLADLDEVVLSAPQAELREVRIERSRLGSVVIHGSTWRGVEITDSKLGYLNARGSQWQDVTFRDCVVTELDLDEATAARVRFERCRIDELHLGGASLSDVDLREADLHVLDGLAGLAGCTISSLQLDALAPLLAAHLGLDVR